MDTKKYDVDYKNAYYFEYCLQIAGQWSTFPYLRFSQLLSNVFDELKQDGYDPFYVEDRVLMEYVQNYINKVSKLL